MKFDYDDVDDDGGGGGGDDDDDSHKRSTLRHEVSEHSCNYCRSVTCYASLIYFHGLSK